MKQNFDKRYEIHHISHQLADDFLKRHHYLAQQGNGFLSREQYGLFAQDNRFVGVIVFAGISVIETLIGAFEGFERYSSQDGFWELTRLSMDDENKEPNLTSWFVSHAIKMLRSERYVRAIISYADSKYHHGYIYQATNFKYYGLAPQKSDFFEKLPGGGTAQVWRGSVKGLEETCHTPTYICACDFSESTLLQVKWQEEPYPKGDNTEYELTIPSQSQMNLFDLFQGGEANA